ncbi:hypothetical protein ABZ234_03935 [Nocardiopsis sp. NPDC006198]|uniref:hypothetical protein n=1 Tax=Nocardiopsis sp. NPDC006198 TaxID=3154472 RepID=UPI0033AFC517
MIRPITCFVADCDTPDCEPWAEADYVPHYATAEEAIAKLVAEWGWSFDGEVLLCATDTARRKCAREGHEWWSGRSDRAAGVREEHCDRCSETRLMATT